MPYCRLLLAMPVLVFVVAPATANPKFYAVFKKEFLEKHPDKKYVEAVDRMDARCLVCHQGKNQNNRNSFGKELSKLLDVDKDVENEKKIADSIKRVLAMKVDPKNEKSETYMDRLKASKWPAGNLEDFKKEPKETPEDSKSLVVKESDTPVEKLFLKVASKQRKGLADLMITRGRGTLDGSRVTCLKVARALQSYDYWPGTAVLVYGYQESKLHSWLIGSDGVLGYSSVAVTLEEVDRQIQDHRAALGVTRLQAGRAPEIRGATLDYAPTRHSADETTLELSRLLMRPPIVTGLKGIKHLVIVPVHSLGVVPFAMLRPYAENEALIDHLSVSVAPSLFDIDQKLQESFLPPVKARMTYKFESPLIVGLSQFPHQSNYYFPSLPGVNKEIAAVAAELKATPLINSQATKHAVLAKAPSADLIYISTHGYADAKDGYLVLWPEEKSNGVWSGQEIHDVKSTKAYVAVLSACQTGLGRVHDAGINGVARSFQMSGVPRVVVSLWSVKDEETAIFMVKLVQAMRKTMVAEALRQTALEMRKEYPDPVVWASFSLFGTPR